jgi:hypothetical protein
MRSLFLIAAAIMAGVGGAVAAELPTFERLGFPITAHQVSVLGSASVKEQSPIPTLRLADMPASPHRNGVWTTLMIDSRTGGLR